MHAFVAAGVGFLLAVLWFDLMFDVQTRKHSGDVLPAEVLTSISTYYRRVTTEASPMNFGVAGVMFATLVAIVIQIGAGADPWWLSWGSLALAGSAFVPALSKVVPNARRLGTGLDSSEQQSILARGIYRAHVGALLRLGSVLLLQLFGR